MTTTDNSLLFPARQEIGSQFTLSQAIVQKTYLIDGILHEWKGTSQEVISPVRISENGKLIAERIGSYPFLTEKEAMLALDAAVKAYSNGCGAWPTMSVEKRIAHVEQFVSRMKEKRSDVVKLLMWEIGKNLPDSEKEFDRTVEYIVDTIEALKSLDRTSSRFEIQQGIAAQIRRAPLGVVLCMGPYNYPLNETYTTLIPALIMGNTVIFKPPKHGVLLHQPLLEAFRDSFPAGVVNTVYGSGSKIIPPIMASGKVNVLAFIGSSRVAGTLKKQHPLPHRLKCVLGLDAKNAGIVLEDAEIDSTVKECITGSLSFNGQRCTALKILFVHKSIVDEFVNKLCAGVSNLKCGMPWDSGVFITPIPEENKVQYLNEIVQDAQAKGAQICNKSGGTYLESLYKPAVLYPVNKDMRVYTEEQFGPVVPIVPFDNIDEPIQYVFESSYGQQVSLFGKNPEVMAALIDKMVNQVSRVNINSQCQRGPDVFPFTGRKDSAEGTLSVSDALKVFSIRTLVAAKLNDTNKALISDITRERRSAFLSTDFLF
ncbi:MAG: NADP-dependent glyceraldehyde-3-phosphate dehydrogenase [Fibrobacterota bacterium]|nr:NADP-dependent glyceraldehyde-3-phosphate dehydrogenase [Chitinispirillaceae bacterium]